MFDLFDNINLKPGMYPAAATTDDTAYVSQIVNLAETEGAVFALLTGSLADADATFAVRVDVGNDPALADAAEATPDQLLGSEALASFNFANDNSVFKVGVKPSEKQYARVTVTPANNTGNVFLAGLWIVKPVQGPAPNPPQ